MTFLLVTSGLFEPRGLALYRFRTRDRLDSGFYPSFRIELSVTLDRRSA
jgi:hypothetical protein